MASQEAQAQIEQASQQVQTLSDIARQHNATMPARQSSGDKNTLPAVEQLRHSAKVIAHRTSSDGNITYAQPHLQLLAPAGIAAITPASVVIDAGNTACVSAGTDVNVVAQGCASYAVASGISLFTYGKASAGDEAVQETGVRLHAASGKVSVQSSSGGTHLTADKAITVASVKKHVTVSAKQHILLTAQGAAIRMERGNITLLCSGSIEFKAGTKELCGPKSSEAEQLKLLKAGTLAECPARLENQASGGATVPFGTAAVQ